MEHFLLDNNIINPSIQKGFLSGINGCVEHIFSICSILDNAIQHELPLAMSFLDLKNAFGSISHSLMHDILDYIKLPTDFVSYITKSYSQLSATIKTKNWCTPIFKIERGVFQGDTLSPLIFLAAFNPLIETCNKLPTCGFNMKLYVPNSTGLPPQNSAIYIERNEETSDEPPGWYYATVKEYFANGQALVEYTDSSTELIDLQSIQWMFTRKGQKPFLPMDKYPPKFPLKRIREESNKPKTYLSTPRSVKGYADDLTVISSNIEHHRLSLNIISQRADLTLKPEKCISITFDGEKIDKKSTIPIGNDFTRNIAESPWNVLGHLIADSPSQSKKASAKKLEINSYITAVKEIDKRPIRGEFKSWILQHYLAPSVYFLLMVDLISDTSISNIQKKLTKFVKKWLNLPRCCTLATLYHPDVLTFKAAFPTSHQRTG